MFSFFFFFILYFWLCFSILFYSSFYWWFIFFMPHWSSVWISFKTFSAVSDKGPEKDGTNSSWRNSTGKIDGKKKKTQVENYNVTCTWGVFDFSLSNFVDSMFYLLYTYNYIFNLTVLDRQLIFLANIEWWFARNETAYACLSTCAKHWPILVSLLSCF